MISDARGGHVSPGVYTEERDVNYTVNSLGITSLGLVGEALKGPAFQAIPIKSWGEYVDYFGGTSTEKYKATGRPKYGMSYVAKAYLEESKRLNVVRVLGLSGYDAGPAWVAYNGSKPVLILRSRMTYTDVSEGSICDTKQENPTPVVTNIQNGGYQSKIYDSDCNPKPGTTVKPKSYQLGLDVTTQTGSVLHYNVSLKSTDKDYIYNVLPMAPDDAYPIYVESVFENNGFDTDLSIKKEEGKVISVGYDYYKLEQDAETSEYKYVKIAEADVTQSDINNSVEKESVPTTGLTENSDSRIKVEVTTKAIADYYMSFKSAFRYAQTPWIVSNILSDGTKNLTMRKLFRVLTISDGNAANYQVKISIEDINPYTGTFTLVVRDFYDTDYAPVILERYSRCNLVEGDANYLPYKVGSADGVYEAKSKYITVEMAEGNLEAYVPAGFLGYPSLFGQNINVAYNTKYQPDVKARKQYFGMTSDNLDADILNFQGKYAYTYSDSDPANLSNGFHMDSIIEKETSMTISVDGVSGYMFTSVSSEKVSNEKFIPRIINANAMDESIYGDIKLRKFTVYPYGGFDGWDINREAEYGRTNTDGYKASKYGGTVYSDKANGTGYGDMLHLGSEANISDYYAYLGACRQFANPQDIDINVFATPGIDWHNNGLLVEDIIDMIEDGEDGRNGDALYIIDSPQYENTGEAMTPDAVATEMNNLGLNSSYACTYFPWIKYLDASENRYIDIPVTKDVVRNFANTDNTSYPWFAPAGLSRGNVDCIKAVKKTTLVEEDALYENCINPVKTFAQDGVKIWGNKTLYGEDSSPLSRINVRRLMIRVKKLVVDASRRLLFEQLDDTLEKQFRSIVEPILSDIKSNRGITDYKLLVENTPETRDQHILPAVIKIKPTPALEYISLSFVVYPESVEFEE